MAYGVPTRLLAQPRRGAAHSFCIWHGDAVRAMCAQPAGRRYPPSLAFCCIRIVAICIVAAVAGELAHSCRRTARGPIIRHPSTLFVVRAQPVCTRGMVPPPQTTANPPCRRAPNHMPPTFQQQPVPTATRRGTLHSAPRPTAWRHPPRLALGGAGFSAICVIVAAAAKTA